MNDYGQVCWWLLAQADQRMSSEHKERIRRRAEAERAAALASGGAHAFDPDTPSDYCFRPAASDRKFRTGPFRECKFAFFARQFEIVVYACWSRPARR